MTRLSETDTKTRSPPDRKGIEALTEPGGHGWHWLGMLCRLPLLNMLEESPPSRYLTSLAHPEDSQGTTAAVSHVLQDQENTGHVPMDNSDSDLPANPTSLQQHLAKLKMLMSRQKAEYESKIASLEQRNRELQSEIKGMHSKLGQQRKWYSLVEMKMRNAERAKEDAEKRNEMLQKEMEEFFETFGEINRWK